MGNGPVTAAPGPESPPSVTLIRLRPYFPVAILLITSLGLLAPLPALAASTPAPAQAAAGSGLSLTPAIQDRVLSTKEKSVSFPVQLFNHTDQPVTLTLSTVDFTSLNQSGGIAFEGGSITGKVSPHGLSSFLTLSARTITLAPDTAQTISASIKDVSKLAVGGHYGAVLAQTVPTTTKTGANRVAINQVLSSLLFLETAGQGTKSIKLLPPVFPKLAFALPNSVNLVISSTGNTQAVPRGTVSLARGTTSQMQGIINENSSLILPDSTRLLQTPLHGNQHPWWPGHYQLIVQYRYDGSLGITTYQQNFLYVNMPVLLLTLIAVILILYIVFKLRRSSGFWRRLRTFNSRTAQAMPLPIAPPTPPVATSVEVVELIEETPPVEPVASPPVPVTETSLEPDKLTPVNVDLEPSEPDAEIALVEPEDEPEPEPVPETPEIVPASKPIKITVAEAVDPELKSPKPKAKKRVKKSPKPKKS